MRKLKLFSQTIPPSCSYCQFGFITQDRASVLCNKKGVMSPQGSCRKFRYAPLKRVPKRPRPLQLHDSADFEL